MQRLAQRLIGGRFVWRAAWLGLWMWVGVAEVAANDWQQVQPGTAVLFRHALAPGAGDPPGFKLDDCRTQRNLSVEGRVQARRIGRAFAERGIKVAAVWSSQWCRTRETADLAFPGQRVDRPAFNSFFDDRGAAADRTRDALALLADWRGPGVLVVVTHQVNITALTDIVPASGEGIVVQSIGLGQSGPPRLKVLGRVNP
jgi:broad specificity phosphatase PhoE